MLYYCKIDRDARYMFSLKLYKGDGNRMSDMRLGGFSVSDTGCLHTLTADDAFVWLNLNDPYRPSPSDGWWTRITYRLLRSSHFGKRKLYRLDPETFDITELSDGTPVITPR
jgi:hypothetical protein